MAPSSPKAPEMVHQTDGRERESSTAAAKELRHGSFQSQPEVYKTLHHHVCVATLLTYTVDRPAKVPSWSGRGKVYI